MKNWIYDLETYPNIFTFTAVFENGKGLRTFEISDRKNQLVAMIDYLRLVKSNNHSLVGFNNEGFDYPVMHYLLEKSKQCRRNNAVLQVTAKEMYDVAMKLIKSDNQFKSIRDNEKHLRQIDLFKIHHFDNKAKATSLKMIEFNMRSDNVEDLPFPVGKTLTFDEMDELVKYNQHDVMETLKFYQKSKPAIDFRENLTEKYGFDCTNFNDTKIGKEYFIDQLEKRIPGSCYIKTERGRKVRQTKRDKIVVGDILFDYLKFERPEFKAVLNWFSKAVIRETKGVFTDLLESDLGDVAQYAEMVTKRKKISDPNDSKNKRYEPTPEHLAQLRKEQPMGWIEEKELKSPKGAKSYYWLYNIAETLNVVIDGFRYDFGTGGIHGSIASSTVREDDEYEIIDADVSSMYPNIGIANRVFPEHLTDKFCDIYEDVYKARKGYAKNTPENAVMKLALNGVYGDSNNEFSPFYDPQYTMTITINGQLSLCLLSERLMTIKGLSIIQCNTDGVTVRIPRIERKKYDAICKHWEIDTGLQLEYAYYKAMFIRDVNNYIALYTDGKVKRKGAYEYENLGWHQNQSALVVQRAVEHELLGKGSAEEFINKHKDKFDFLLRTKVPRSSKLIMVMDDGQEVEQQNICRYYPSEQGGKLIKLMPPLKPGGEVRRMAVDKEWKVKTCNNINDFDWEVDYRYYIKEARKLIDVVYGLEVEFDEKDEDND